MSSALFREEALRHLSHPNTHSSLFSEPKVPSLWGWCALACVMLAGIAWCVGGRITRTVTLSGMVIPADSTVMALRIPHDSDVLHVHARVGQHVAPHELLAELQPKGLAAQWQHLHHTQGILRQRAHALQQRITQHTAQHHQRITALTQTYRQGLGYHRATLQHLEQLIAQQHQLWTHRHVTWHDVHQALAARSQTHASLLQLHSNHHHLLTEAHANLDRWRREQALLQDRLIAARHELADLQATYRASQQLRSPQGGTLVGVHITEGEHLTAHTPALMLRAHAPDAPPYGVITLAPGPALRAGMPARVQPASRTPVQWVPARITDVSPYPVSPHTIQTEMGPSYPVSHGTPLMLAHVTWAAHPALTPGTPIVAEILLESISPLSWIRSRWHLS